MFAAHLNTTTPVSFTALQKATGLSATKLTMALVEAGGTVAVLDGGFVLCNAAPVKAPRKTGPRGPIARTQPRQEAARLVLAAALANGPTTAKFVMEACNGAFKYTDLLLVAREFVANGAITEGHHGRTAIWTLVVTPDVVVEAPVDEVVAGS